MQKANQLIVNYLLYLKHARQVADLDQLDVAISILQDVMHVEAPASSPELLTLLDQAYNITKPSSDQFKNDGNAAMKEKDYKKAQQCYTKAIENSMRYGEPLESRSIYFANRAMAEHELGNIKAALADCQESVKLNPAYTKASLRMAQYLEEDGQTPQAHEVYERLLSLDPANQQLADSVARTGAQNKQPAAPQMPNGFENMLPGMDQLKDDPEMREIMSNPKMAALAAQIQQNPMSAMSALSDPELAPLVQKMMMKISPQLGGMLGGMFGQK